MLDFTGWYDASPWEIESLYNWDMGNGDTATMHLYVLDQSPNPLRIYSIVYLYLANGDMIEKYFYSDLRRRKVFPNEITTYGDIVFTESGTVTLDSYTSDPTVNLGNYDSFFNRSDHRSLVGGKMRAWEFAKGEVYGYVSTWVEAPTMGVDAKIYGLDTPGGIDIDESRIANGFMLTFTDMPGPAGVTIRLRFPRRKRYFTRIGSKRAIDNWRPVYR